MKEKQLVWLSLSICIRFDKWRAGGRAASGIPTNLAGCRVPSEFASVGFTAARKKKRDFTRDWSKAESRNLNKLALQQI